VELSAIYYGQILQMKENQDLVLLLEVQASVGVKISATSSIIETT
jgi:hypothetical protein